MYSRGKKTATKCCLTYAGPMCYLLHKLIISKLNHRIKKIDAFVGSPRDELSLDKEYL